MNVREWNSRVVADAAHDEVIADKQRVLHRAGRNDACLTDGAINEEKYETDPEPGDDFTANFLFGAEFFLRLFCGRLLHESPNQAKIFRTGGTNGASGFRWDGSRRWHRRKRGRGWSRSPRVRSEFQWQDK